MVKVRQLISELLEHEMNNQVSVYINDNEFDFELDEHTYYKETHIVANTNDVILLDKDEFEEMKERIKELEAEVEDLKAE